MLRVYLPQTMKFAHRLRHIVAGRISQRDVQVRRDYVGVRHLSPITKIDFTRKFNNFRNYDGTLQYRPTPTNFLIESTPGSALLLVFDIYINVGLW
jgi:hypothetical protein